MGLFGKSKGENKGETVQNSAPQKKATDDLTKVLDESVWESVQEDMRANKTFILRDNGETKYVALVFETDQVGGFAGKDAKKDESKGSIIEAIKTGRIKTYLRNDMMQSGCFTIVPDKDTIDNMDEFTLFADAKYILATVDVAGVINTAAENPNDPDSPEVTIDFDTIKDIVRTEGDVHTLFSYRGNVGPVFNEGSAENDAEDIESDPFEDDSGESASEPAAAPAAAPVAAPVSSPVGSYGDDDDEELGSGDEILPDDLTAPGDDTGIPIESLYGDDDIVGSGYIDDDDLIGSGSSMPVGNSPDADFNNDDLGGYDEYEDITADVVQDWVVRTFYSEDLGLEISTQPFDAQFLHGNEYIPFNENRGEGWLNEYLSNMAKEANTRMERMHSANLFRMRERYMRAIQESCETIAKQLDTNDESTQYGMIRRVIEENRDANLDHVDDAVSAKQQQLENAWNAQLDQIGEIAAQEARQTYMDRHLKTHQADLDSLVEREKDLIQSDYHLAMQRMNDDRKAEATKLLDLAVGEALTKMSSIYIKVLDEESKEYEKISAEMAKFIDDNRKDEKARIEALAEERRQVTRANEVRAEYIQKIKSITAEYEVQKVAFRADIDRLRKDHADEIRNRSSELSSKYEIEKARADSLQSQVDTLVAQYSDLENRKNAEYAARIDALQAENDNKTKEIQHLMTMKRNESKIVIMLAIAILLICIGVGVIIGNVTAKAAELPAEQQSVSDTVSFDMSGDVEDVENGDAGLTDDNS